MISIGNFAALADAAAMIGIVLAEAMALYVVYGAAERALGERLIQRLQQS